MKHTPRKRFGQNFLVDATIIRRICDAINPLADELIIEIGPGQAALTLPMLERGPQLVVVEIDRDLAGTLDLRFRGNDQLRVVQGDALETDFGSLVSGKPYRLVGNLPYNISTPLIFHILGQEELPGDMHFMLQKEVVDRMAAVPGTKAYGRLGVMCQNLCQVSALFDIPPTAFNPAPKVTSSLVRLEPRPQPLSGRELLKSLDTVVRAAFSKRRKTLRNAMSGTLDADQIKSAGVDPSERAEQLGLEQFIALAAVLNQQN